MPETKKKLKHSSSFIVRMVAVGIAMVIIKIINSFIPTWFDWTPAEFHLFYIWAALIFGIHLLLLAKEEK